MERFRSLSFKNKILFATITVILSLSLGILAASRLILIPALTDELKRRGIGIAQSMADLGKSYMLHEDIPNLTGLVFDTAFLSERRQLVAYVFITDAGAKVLAHSFTTEFPKPLIGINPIKPGLTHAIRQVQIQGYDSYDIAVPIMEGIYQIGTAHVGLSKKHIDHLVDQLRNAYLGITFIIIILFFLISHWLSNYITRPISQLIQVADEISRGHFHIEPALAQVVYKEGGRDEIVQLADSINNMAKNLEVSQKQLRESEEKYRSLFDSGPNPIFVLDAQTQEILDANPSAVESYGYPKAELKKLTFADLGGMESGETAVSGADKMCGGSEHLVVSKVQHFKKGHRQFYVNIHGCATRYKDREALIVATTDITEIIEKEAQLIQASKLTTLGQMSASIAHELNQPLNAIKVGNEFLKMMTQEGRQIPDEDLLQVVNEVGNQVDRAAEIINHLRDFSRKADRVKEKVDINRSIRAVHSLLSQQLHLENIDLDLRLDPGTPLIWGQANRFEQVFFNLVTNARDAVAQKRQQGGASERQKIAIRTRQELGRVIVEVADTGMGMSAAVKEHIFEPFYTTKETGKGTGLGLSIIYGIVKDYGGEIQVDSREGEGTTFRLSFPALAT
ncbi:MAG: PAS domain S-box protein [Deltaproteobacteria bacterium]|nr:PAS domain S-box protein [Deltaproteobacteria bacterium]